MEICKNSRDDMRWCADEYHKLFSDGWQNRPGIENDIRIYKRYSFYSICRSLLSGRYLFDDNGKEVIYNDLNRFEKEIDSSLTSIKEIKLNQNFSLLIEEKIEMDVSLLEVIKSIRLFARAILSNFRGLERSPIDVVYSDIIYKEVFEEYLDIIRWVIPLCAMDHLFVDTDNYYMRLISLYGEINNYCNSLKASGESLDFVDYIYFTLRDKCGVLLDKINAESDRRILTAEDPTVDRETLDTGYRMMLNKFDYTLGDVELRDNESVEGLINKYNFNKEKLSFGEMILLARVFQKYGERGIIRLKALVDIFDKKYLETVNKAFGKDSQRYNRYSLQTLRNYIHNCYFANIIKYDYDYARSCSEIEAIERIQIDKGISHKELSFYPYWCFADRLKFDLDEMLNKNLTLDLSLLRKKIESFERIVNKLEETFEWCKNRKCYPIQNIFYECLVRDARSRIVVFMPSSFSRPINYNLNISNYQIKVAYYKNMLESFEIGLNSKQIKSDLINIKNDNLKVISVFIAVMAFLFGNISVSSKLPMLDFPQIIKYSLSLGIILLIFVFGVFVMSTPAYSKFKDIVKSPKIIISLTLILFFTCALIVLFIFDSAR